jgi:hypothetical protein
MWAVRRRPRRVGAWRVWQSNLIRQLASFKIDQPSRGSKRAPLDAVALVETDVASVGGLPPTAVRVKLAAESRADDPAAGGVGDGVEMGGMGMGGSGGGGGGVGGDGGGGAGGGGGVGGGVRLVTHIGKSVPGVADGIGIATGPRTLAVPKRC